MGVQSAEKTRARRNRIGACTAVPRLGRTRLSAPIGGEMFLFLPWLARLVGPPNGRVSAGGSPGRTNDGRVVRNFKLEPATREVQSRKVVPRAVYLFEKGFFFVLTGMPRPALGESCTTSGKYFAIFPPHKKKKI